MWSFCLVLMDFDTAFLKSDIYDWADEVEKEFSVAGTEDKFSQCSQDTWLYYSTSSSLPFDDVRPKPFDRSEGRGKQKPRNKPRTSKGNRIARCIHEKSTVKQSLDGPSTETARLLGRLDGLFCAADMETVKETVVAMVQSRQKDFASCAASHAWASNFEEHKKKHQTKNVTKSVNQAKAVSKEKQRVVRHQVMDGAVLVVTRKPKVPEKTPAATPIKASKKLKKIPPPSPTPSRNSRADSSRDWKSDKRSLLDSDTCGFRISSSLSSSSKSKRSSSRSLNEEKNKQPDARKNVW